MGYQLIWLNRFEESFGLYARGVEMAGDERSATRASLIGGGGALAGLAGFFDISQERLAEAEAMAREVGAERELGAIFWGRCLVDWSYVRLPEAIRSGRHCVEHLRKAGDMWTLVDGLSWLSFPLGFGGYPDEGRAVAQEALDLAQKLGHVGGEILARRGITLTDATTDPDMERIERQIQKDLELCESIQSPWSSQSHAWLGMSATKRGNFEEGLRYADEAIRIEPTSAWSGVGWTSRLVNRAYAGDVDVCATMVEEKLAFLKSLGDPTPMGAFLMLTGAAEACAVLGMNQTAAELYPHVAERVHLMPTRPFDWGLTERFAGMAAAAAGLWEEAERHHLAALRQVDELPNRLDAPQVDYWYGRMLIDRGNPNDRDRALQLIESAQSKAAALGLPVLARAEELAG
jgi:hypothetical protein